MKTRRFSSMLSYPVVAFFFTLAKLLHKSEDYKVVSKRVTLDGVVYKVSICGVMYTFTLTFKSLIPEFSIAWKKKIKFIIYLKVSKSVVKRSIYPRYYTPGFEIPDLDIFANTIGDMHLISVLKDVFETMSEFSFTRGNKNAVITPSKEKMELLRDIEQEMNHFGLWHNDKKLASELYENIKHFLENPPKSRKKNSGDTHQFNTQGLNRPRTRSAALRAALGEELVLPS